MKDQELFEQIYAERFAAISAYIMHKLHTDYATAEDIAGETFLRLQLKWDKITPHTTGVITAWLYTTAEHLSMDHIKKQNFRGVVYLDPAMEHEFSDRLAEVTQIHEELDYHILLTKIRKLLSPREWELFTAIYIENLPQEMILHRFHLRTDQLYLRKSRLKAKLQKHRESLMAPHDTSQTGKERGQ